MEAEGVIGFSLDAHRLVRTRFALSITAELINALEVLVHPARAPYARHWVASTARGLDRRRYDVLLTMAEEATWYVPDFLVPLPDGYESTVDDELDVVASTPAERVRQELRLAFRIGPPEDSPLLERVVAATGDPRRPLPRLIAAVLDRHGENGLAHRLADEMRAFWTAELAELWPSVRAVNDADVRHHSFEAGRQGVDRMFELLHPEVMWDGVRVGLPRPFELTLDVSGGLVLVPSAFLPRPAVWFGTGQAAMIGYPARARGHVWAPASGAGAPGTLGAGNGAPVLGDGWERLLADLSVPRSTSELAARQRLAPSTVSYHLTRLYRAGLVLRNRHGRRVLYERTERATETMKALGLDVN